MRLLVTLIMSLLLSFSAFANIGEEVELKLKSTNLEGMKIFKEGNQLNIFNHEIKYATHMRLVDLKSMAKAYDFDFVSTFFTSGRSYPYDNVVALIGKVNGKHQLITYFIRDGLASVVVYNLKKVEENKLIVQGVLDGYNYEVNASQLFP